MDVAPIIETRLNRTCFFTNVLTMHMPASPNRNAPDSVLRDRLAAVRRRIRRYVLAEGAAYALAWLGVCFWGGLIADWFFEPSPATRLAALAAVVAGFAYVLIRFIVVRSFVRLSDENMATLVERRFPELNDSLLTAVILGRSASATEEYDPHLLERTYDEAVRATDHLEIERIFDRRPLRRGQVASVATLIAVAVFAIISPSDLKIFADRAFCLSSDRWPRRTRLEIVGFEGGVRKIAVGDDCEIVVRADAKKQVVPASVQIRYRDENGARGSLTMDRVGVADLTKESYQEYVCVRRNVTSPVTFDVRGGDDVIAGLKIQVVESPHVAEWSVRCEYPAYMRRSPRTISAAGMMQIPKGASAAFRAKTNKPLERVQIDLLVEGREPVVERISGSALTDSARGFEYKLPTLEKDASLVFTLFDADGIKSREPIRFAVSALQDSPPEVAAQLDGIGSAITPRARIPFVGRASDDYGLRRIWFESAEESKKGVEIPFVDLPDAPAERKLDDAALDLAPLQLKIGSRIQLALKASDYCDLEQSPNVGSSEKWTLDLVTPEKLRTQLEARELSLRQRFESIIQETEETRDLLTRIKSKDDGKSSVDKKHGSEKPADADKVNSREPGDAKESTAPTPERLNADRLLYAQRALVNCRKNAQETADVANSFDDIRKQMVNNRIDNEEAKERLQKGVAEPLRRIASTMMPELERTLDRLQSALESNEFASTLADTAEKQTAAVLQAMQKALDKMLEMEDFNEAVELLRDVIESQDKLRKDVEQKRKQSLRDLLE